MQPLEGVCMCYESTLAANGMKCVIKTTVVLVLILMLYGCNESASNLTTVDPVSDPGDGKYSFVIILTDDQRWDTLWAMPIVQDKLAARGVTFDNAFVSMPLCCPSRASLLAGGFYAHNTGVLANTPPNGGVEKFKDDETIATILQKSGYKTALIGKYLNGYRRIAPYIPPGWDKFVVPEENKYFDYMVTLGTSTDQPGQGEIVGPIAEYITDFERQEAVDFLDLYGDSQFLLVLSTTAAHFPISLVPEDEYLFQDFFYRGGAYGEEDVSDKPTFIQSLQKGPKDGGTRKQLSSLQAVDRAVGAIVEKIEDMGKRDRTVFIYTSDNGYLWGEHRCWAKGRPYEESLRVPLVLVMPEIQSRHDDHMVVANLDIGPTLLELAEKSRQTDGLSLVPILKNTSAPWRNEFLIESYGFIDEPGYEWSGLRINDATGEWKYVEHGGGEKELYDLANDPYEEENLSADPDHRGTVDQLAARLDESRGLAIYDKVAPPVVRGQPYHFQINAGGGKEPYSWSIVKGILPQGLTLDEQEGLISGTPTKMEKREISVQVQDSSTSAYTGLPQAFLRTFSLTVTSAGVSATVIENRPPGAHAGGKQTVSEGHPVTLDASRSSGSDGEVLSFEWRQTGGIPVILSIPHHVAPVFTAPQVNSSKEILTFELTVTDEDGLTDTDTAVIEVSKQKSPASISIPVAHDCSLVPE
jgi:arylsulfatase A-like enzyme